MGIRNLERMFHPRSVAVIGASETPGHIGQAVMHNLIDGGFEGTIYPICDHPTVGNRECYPSLNLLGVGADLAVIAAPIDQAADHVRQCAQMGVGAAIIIAGGGKEIGAKGAEVEAAIRLAVGDSSMRVLGPNCIGLICARCKLNVSLIHNPPRPGRIAFVTQSGAIGTSILDYACKEHIGFSHFINIGSMLDIDFGDAIDYLGNDPAVGSIVMYVERLEHIRKFMSAARAVARIKPIIALKAGRSSAGIRAATSHTGALAGDDAIYDAAFQRAGILRVKTFEELFDCTELLAKQPRPQKTGLVVVSNAGGPAVMAADALSDYGVEPANLTAATVERLATILPPSWSRTNPIDILGQATPQLYQDVIKIVLEASETDGLLVMLAPQALADATAVARLLSATLTNQPIPVITAWLGGDTVETARGIFNQTGIPTFDSPERAVRAFIDLYRYARNVEILQQVPAKLQRRLEFDRSKVQRIIDQRLAPKLVWMDEVDTKDLLTAYGIPVNHTRRAVDADQAKALAEEMGYPVALKIDSPHILHKSDCVGVALNLNTAAKVRKAFLRICGNAKTYFPDAEIRGVTVQPMLTRADHELILGVKRDREFGPVMLFGQGGVSTEIMNDRALALPPLNRLLARRLMEQTRIYRLLRGYRNFAPVDLTFLEELLIRLAQLVTDFAEIREIDINPLMIGRTLCCVADARIALEPAHVKAPMHLAISPYPNQFDREVDWPGIGRIRLRPIRPEDAPLMEALFTTLSSQTIYFRFFSPMKSLPPSMLARFTQIDYDREIALVAGRETPAGEDLMGVARVIDTLNPCEAEFAVLVGDRWHGKGIGAALLKECLRIAKLRGVTTVWGSVLAENTQMLALGRKLHFAIKRVPESSEYELRLDLGNIPEEALK
jgi:acetyltransferase